jgi:hypothetical protein
MTFKPFDKMMERIDNAREDSNVALFYDLLLLGEMLTKVVASGLVAAIQDDRDRHRYQQLYTLVRAGGIGDWEKVINTVLTGPASQHLLSLAKDEQRELTQTLSKGSWQYDATELLTSCVRCVDPQWENIPTKVGARRWFSTFVRLRNKTRGHGATLSSAINSIVGDLEQSIDMFIDNYSLFNRSWAYISRNLSGKYRIAKLSDKATSFEPLKSKQGMSINIPDGIYIHFDETNKFTQIVNVELIYTTIDAMDFFFPNGAFTDDKFELLSYITDERLYSSSTPYLMPASSLPRSETQGLGILDLQGKSFGNLPPKPNDYIERSTLEQELYTELVNDRRHPIITLIGRGGIGKTWLTLSVLHKIAEQEKFTAILWFSARDIDLLPVGPKLVQPHILTERDIADEFTRLMNPSKSREKDFKPIPYMREQLEKSDEGPILFVFDNFETVRSPGELFVWLDTYVRLPNKILVTTRHREFKGDYPVEVSGMTDSEAEELVNQTAKLLGISDLLNYKYVQELLDEASGHPYVIKVLLGEVAKAHSLVKIERIIASQDNILDALFERTYISLSPVAKRVFLTICNWRSIIPVLALEAVLLRPSNEKMDVRKAVEELERSSFIETSISLQDKEEFIAVPLVAFLFGQRKIAVSPMKSAVESDTELLIEFGASQQSDVHHGIAPRIIRLFNNIADRIIQEKDTVDEHKPMLEFIARQYPPAWLLMADLFENIDRIRNLDLAKDAIKRFLEIQTGNIVEQYNAWRRLAALSRKTQDYTGEIHALVALSSLDNSNIDEASNAANILNTLLKDQKWNPDSDEKKVLVRKITDIMERRIDEADATDCSRLAWLLMHLHNYDRAKQIVSIGLQKDPENEFCKNLSFRLSRF